jgi:methylated-DNA-protein-cysteine methyltransferase-like protein
MLLTHFFDYIISDTRSSSQFRQVQLLHFSTAAHVVHQIVGVSFAANKSHRFFPCWIAQAEQALVTRLFSSAFASSVESPFAVCSVKFFHYIRQGVMRSISKRCFAPGWAHLTQLSFSLSRNFLLRFIYFSSELLCNFQIALHSLHTTRNFEKGLLPVLPATHYHFAMSTWDPVYRLVKRIPRGRVTTYGLLARVLQLRGGARTAGHAMAASPTGKGIPWHRVVGAGGKLLIREPYSSLQRKLLESEGVTVLESRIPIKKYLWLPALPKRARKARS